MYNDLMETQPLIPERDIHRLFEIGVFIKGMNAAIEMVAGVALYLVSADAVSSFMIWAAQSELLEDPHDIISNYLLHLSQSFSVGSKSFAAFYLFSHGIVKLFLVAGLLRNKYWAYPASLVIMGLFIVYQVYRYNITHSLWLVVLTVFDVLVMWLIWHEYSLVRAGKPLT